MFDSYPGTDFWHVHTVDAALDKDWVVGTSATDFSSPKLYDHRMFIKDHDEGNIMSNSYIDEVLTTRIKLPRTVPLYSCNEFSLIASRVGTASVSD